MERRRGIGSVETGLRVLAALAEAGAPAPLSEVARRAGLSASQAHRYLVSLIAAGTAQQDAASGLYDLGPGALRLGLAALARLDVFARADAAFAAFTRETGRTCLLAVMGDAGPTIVRWFAGRPPVITSLGLGSVLPLNGSATGRAFRDARPARVDGDLIPGLRATAAPVFDLQGQVALVATAIASPGIDCAGDAAAEAALRAACRAVTAAIGGSAMDNRFDDAESPPHIAPKRKGASA